MAERPNEDPKHHIQARPEKTNYLENMSECNCAGNHNKFFHVDDYYRYIPENFKGEEQIKFIKNVINRTGKVFAKKNSSQRPVATSVHRDVVEDFGNTIRCGTGYLEKFIGIFPEAAGSECGSQSVTTAWKFQVSTATHLIRDNEEAEGMKFGMFYDSEEEKDKMEFLYGVNVVGNDDDERINSDLCNVVCVTDNSNLADKLIKLIEEVPERTPNSGFVDTWEPYGMIVAHPHGCCKRISFGKFHTTDIYVLKDSNLMTIKKDTHFKTKDTINANHSGEHPSIFAFSYEKSKARNMGKLEYDIQVEIPRSGFHMQNKWDSAGWRNVEFPDGAIFKSLDGNLIDVPIGTAFQIVDWPQASFTYDIPTCEGSSGARVFRLVSNLNRDPMIWFVKVTHAGRLKDHGDRNYSVKVKFDLIHGGDNGAVGGK